MEQNIMKPCECNICKPKNQWAIVLTCPGDGRIVSVIGSFDDQEKPSITHVRQAMRSDYHYFVTQFFDEDEDR